MLPNFSVSLAKSVSDDSPSFGNILLISKLVKVLKKIEKNQALSQKEQDILSRGKQLVSKIIAGSRVVENKEFKSALFPIEEGIATYSYALTTMEALNLYEEAQESTLFFEKLLGQLEETEKAENANIEFDLLKKFFWALGDSFRGEVHRREYPLPKKLETPLPA